MSVASEAPTAAPRARAGTQATRRRLWVVVGRLRSELSLAAEIAALTGFVFARPILGSFGDSPESFIARGGDGRTVLAFGAAVALIPPLAIAGGAALVGLAGALAGGRLDPSGPRPPVWRRALRQSRLLLQLGAVGALGGLAGLQLLRMLTSLGDTVTGGLAAGIGVGLLAARWRSILVSRFLRYAGALTVLLLVQFLFLSPASSLVLGGRSAPVDAAAAAALDARLGDDAPPIVMVVLDALPTASLLDGNGAIDRELYPNLARLVDDATWYRNHTTVAPNTVEAVPAILTGEEPDGTGTPPVASAHPRNLFTLLGGHYDVQATEQVTALCPRSLCADAAPGGIGPLLRDARSLWSTNLAANRDVPPGLPGAFGSRHADLAAWIESRDFDPDQAPTLHFAHVLLPHDPFNWLPGGARYQAPQPPTGLAFGVWGDFGGEVGAQRHVLQTQATDELLGRLFDRLRAAGTYDDALIVVTADHGAAFTPDAPPRGVDESQFADILWVPLIVKEPSQTESVVDDRNVQTVDILPLVARALGLDPSGDLGWEVDGASPGGGPERDPADKTILDWALSSWRPEDGDWLQVDGRGGLEQVVGADWVEGAGDRAVWQRTRYGDLVGTDVNDLAQGQAADVALEMEHPDRFRNLDAGQPLPLELLGFAWVDEDEAVALAVDGEIAAVAPARVTGFGIAAVHALLYPGSLGDGDGELTAYLVEGPTDDPVLHPLDIVPRTP